MSNGAQVLKVPDISGSKKADLVHFIRGTLDFHRLALQEYIRLPTYQSIDDSRLPLVVREADTIL